MPEITIAKYLFERIHQIQVDTIFGLPGDFNLRLLDHIYEVDGLRWAGNANELNAAYAADGYARVKGLAAIVTTFGVGELSALNGIAGSYAEHVGVLHIVGAPSTASQGKHMLLHHTLGNGDFTVFHRMSSNISKTTSFIMDPHSAPSEIDRCIRTAFVYQRPVYLALPSNFFDVPVDASLLDTPIDLSLPSNDIETEVEIVQIILDLVKAAKNPIILVDACASRHNVKEETKELIENSQFPTFVTPMGKGAVNEQHPRFGGVYVGNLSHPDVKEVVENADLVLSVGALLSDFNTGAFSYGYKTKNIVEFHSDHIKIRNATYPGIQFKHVLQELNKSIASVVTSYVPKPIVRPSVSSTTSSLKDAPLSQIHLWNSFGNWLRSGDIVITETGTSAFGIVQTRFPENVSGISQVLWGSIGYTVGSCLGATMAAEEIDKKKRVVLFVGDGSLQLTVQEISTMIKWGLTPYIFVLNNNGYTIEKLIHGEKEDYNNIQNWDHQLLLPFFGAKKYESLRVGTMGKFDSLLEDPAFAQNDKIRLIEVMLPTMDAPESLVKQAQMTASVNSQSKA